MISKRQSIISTFIGLIISLVNAVVQLLTIYFVLYKYGSQFNGFIKIASGFSFFFSTADSALGIATTFLLIKPIKNEDWLSANNIFSSSLKKYRNGALRYFGLAIFVSLCYAVLTSIQANSPDGVFNINHINIKSLTLTGSLTGNVGIYELVLICIIFSFRNFILSLFFNAYENALAAINKVGVIKISTLISEVLSSTIILVLINTIDTPVWVVFIPIFTIGITRGILIYHYAKIKCPWIKFNKDAVNFRLDVEADRISFSNIGEMLILNLDVVICGLLLGLRVSSALSLYLVVATNTRLIIKNFIISFREYFMAIISRKGRLLWENYAKYELYMTIICLFAFINLSILSPYFVAALYGDIMLKSSDTTSLGEFKAVEKMLFNPEFSILYAACASIDVLNEGRNLLIKSKGRNKSLTKFNIICGVIYICTVLIGCEYFIIVKKDIYSSLLLMYSVKLIMLSVILFSFYGYIWKYITYNSNFRFTLNNWAILFITSVITIIVQRYIINSFMPVEKYSITKNGNIPKLSSLIILFFLTIIISSISIISISFILSPKIMSGIFLSLPFVSYFVNIWKIKATAEKLSKNNMESYELDTSYVENIELSINIKDVEAIDEEREDLIYKVKG